MSASEIRPAAGQAGRADSAHVADGQPPSEVIRVSSPASLLAAVPVVLRFHPSEPSIVVLGVRQSSSEVAVTVRHDIGDLHSPDAFALHTASILAAQRVDKAVAVGYGPGDLVTPVADSLRTRFDEFGITVAELLRVQDGRYWSYVCANPECCPPDGKAFDLEAHPVTPKYAGLVLASREALAATVAPVTGDAAKAMLAATRAARQRAARLADGAGRRARQQALDEAGLQAVSDAIRLYEEGGKLESHKEAAWLTLVLKALPVRDDAWARMLPEHRGAHLRLWTDLTTLARPRYVAAPASLLALTAWQDGDGALANVALDRALADNPRYRMARLLRMALDSGAHPSLARPPMTSEEVARAYAASREARKRTAAAANDPAATGA
jgi:hypothetical protein